MQQQVTKGGSLDVPNKGQLIVFEGPDGVGKTTVSKMVCEELKRKGIAADWLSLPGSVPGSLGHHVNRLHHEHRELGVESIDPTSLQLLHAAAHVDAINRHVRPTLAAGRWLILDRYWWSTIVYGRVLGACGRSLAMLEDLARHHWSDVPLDVMFLLSRGTESQDASGAQLSKEYATIASQLESRCPVVHLRNDGAVQTAVERVLESLVPLPKRSGRLLDATDLVVAVKKGKATNKRRRSRLRRRSDQPRTTPVYDSYWRFAAERQAILFKRLEAAPSPWTDDEILRRYRFTNAYRAADRVSQYLIRQVIYDENWAAQDIVFRILLFKIFNKIETWEFLENTFGPLAYENFNARAFGSELSRLRSSGRPIYSSAYIMPSPSFGYRHKHENHLAILGYMMKDSLPHRLQDATSLEQVFRILIRYPSLGSFLAFQYAIDLNYSSVVDFSEMSFVVPGPGAMNGIEKCFSDKGGLTDDGLIAWVTDRQELEFDRLGIEFRNLAGRRLQLIDCQNLFCEIDKYARIRHPEYPGRSGRKRIKQVFSPRPEPLRLWFPPKWGIFFEPLSQDVQHCNEGLFSRVCE